MIRKSYEVLCIENTFETIMETRLSNAAFLGLERGAYDGTNLYSMDLIRVAGVSGFTRPQVLKKAKKWAESQVGSLFTKIKKTELALYLEWKPEILESLETGFLINEDMDTVKSLNQFKFYQNLIHLMLGKNKLEIHPEFIEMLLGNTYTSYGTLHRTVIKTTLKTIQEKTGEIFEYEGSKDGLIFTRKKVN